MPLNSPDPLVSINALVEKIGDTVEIGAGTVLTADQFHERQQAGARIIFAPDTNRDAITA